MKAQDPLTIEQLNERVSKYFAQELLQDIRKGLPNGAFEIWGYDVGDFSGDKVYDFAVSIKREGDDKRYNDIYLFVDEEGEMRKVFHDTLGFFRLPIEAGLAISDNICRITHKLKDGDWEVKGYRYSNGVLMQADNYAIEKQGNFSRESYQNLQTLESYEHYSISDGREIIFNNQYFTIPCYSRGRNLNSGYQLLVKLNSSQNITKGSFYWSNSNDCSATLRTAYDDDYVYFSAVIKDDEIVLPSSIVADSVCDRVELWIDTYSMANRFKSGKKTRDFRNKTDTNIYAFHISLGDLYNESAAKVKVSTSNTLDETQTNAAKQVKVITSKVDSGYMVRLKIPFTLLGFSKPPLEVKPIEYGATFVIKDIDNPYKPNEVTIMATSQNFDQTQPASYGGIIFIPEKKYYGEANNILTELIKMRLREIGY